MSVPQRPVAARDAPAGDHPRSPRNGWRAVNALWLALGLAVFVLAGVGTPARGVAMAAGLAAGLTPSERAWLAAHPVLRLGANRSAPPFSYLERGEHRGIDADILRRLAQALGVRLELVIDPPWDEVQALARDGQVDLLSLLPPATERLSYLAYTDPVVEIDYALFVRSDPPPAPGVADLVGHKVAVTGSFAVRKWLERDYPGVLVVATASAIDALRALSTGQADGAVSTVGGASWLVRQEGIVNLRLQQVLYRPPLVVGVRKDWPELVTILNKAIAQLDRAEIDRIRAAHVPLPGSGYSREQLALVVLGAALLALAAVALINRQALRRERGLRESEQQATLSLAQTHARLQAQVLAREQAQAALQASEGQYRLLFESSLDGLMQTRPDGSVLAANRVAREIFGMTLAQMQAGGRTVLVDTSDERVHRLLREREATGHARGELRMRRGDGSCFEAEISSALYIGGDGQPVTSMVIRDVTARRQSDAQLRLLEACVANLNDVVLITEAEPFSSPGPRIVFVNEAFTRLTGYTREEVIGRTPRLLQGLKTDRAELARVDAALRRWERVSAEVVNYRKDGSEFWLEMQIAPVADDNGWYTHWVSIERDITERKQAEATRQSLEQQLREAQEMEAIGTLAGGIAHDFNNILGAILGNVALAQQDLPLAHAARPSVEQIGRAAARARSLVEQILTFSRRQPQRLHAQALAPVVKETTELLRATLPATVELRSELSAEPLHVLADATQLQQVLVNLCTNAWHALRGSSGRIVIGLQPHDAGAGSALAPPAGMPPGRYAHLSVSDNGCGIDETTRLRMFEPFFTTKPAGTGTGLGLSVVHGIVSGHHGSIGVRSTVGQGSTFDIWLPVVDAPALAADGAEADGDAAGSGRGEHVLYVDDDEVMRLMVGRLLERQGWRVTCAEDAAAALRVVRGAPDAFDIVVTDFNMPSQSGLDLARELRGLAPRLPVVISSGFLPPQLQAEADAIGVAALLRKENTVEELGVVVARVLGRPG
jgi:PAS domain S-box-containing protein